MKTFHSIVAVCVLSCPFSSLEAQDKQAESKSSQPQLQFQLDYQSQRTKLLENRVELLKSLQQVEEENSQAEIKSLALEAEMLNNRNRQSEAELTSKKSELERLKKLYAQGVVTNREYEAARQEVIRREFEVKHLAKEAEQQKQQADAAEISRKRRRLENELRLSDARLKLLEAEFRVKELKRALEGQ